MQASSPFPPEPLSSGAAPGNDNATTPRSPPQVPSDDTIETVCELATAIREWRKEADNLKSGIQSIRDSKYRCRNAYQNLKTLEAVNLSALQAAHRATTGPALKSCVDDATWEKFSKASSEIRSHLHKLQNAYEEYSLSLEELKINEEELTLVQADFRDAISQVNITKTKMVIAWADTPTAADSPPPAADSPPPKKRCRTSE